MATTRLFVGNLAEGVDQDELQDAVRLALAHLPQGLAAHPQSSVITTTAPGTHRVASLADALQLAVCRPAPAALTSRNTASSEHQPEHGYGLCSENTHVQFVRAQVAHVADSSRTVESAHQGVDMTSKLFVGNVAEGTESHELSDVVPPGGSPALSCTDSVSIAALSP